MDAAGKQVMESWGLRLCLINSMAVIWPKPSSGCQYMVTVILFPKLSFIVQVQGRYVSFYRAAPHAFL